MSGTISRSDKFTQTQKTPDFFSDILDDFFAHPITGDIVRIKNEQSIKQSVRNLILTNYGERLFNPNIGSNLQNSLFDFGDGVTTSDIQYHIKQTLDNYEPRIYILNVNVTVDDTQQTLFVNIVFAIINTTNVQSVDILLKRVR